MLSIFLRASENMKSIASEDWLGFGRQVVVAALTLLATRWFIKRRRLIVAIEKLPGPPLSHRILGHLGDLGRTVGTIPTHPQLPRLFEYMQGVSQKYTEHGLLRICVFNPYIVPFARMPIFIFDPFLARQLLTDKKITSKLVKDPRTSRGLAPLTADSFFLMHDDDPLWKMHRKIAAQSFHQSMLEVSNSTALHLLYTKIFPVWDEVLQNSPTGGIAVEMAEWSTRVTLEMIGKVAFGYSFGALVKNVAEDSEDEEVSLYNMFHFMLTFMARKLRSPPLVSLLWIKDRWKFRQYSQRMDSIIASIVKSRLSEAQLYDMGTRSDSKQKEHSDLLSYMLSNNKNGQEQRMDYRYIFGNTRALLLAGHDSTAGALAGCLWEIAKSQTVQARLHAELDMAFEKADNITSIPYKDLMQLQYLDAVVKEALRLHAPAGAVRMAVEDFELKSKDGKNSYLIPAGAKIFNFDAVGNLNDAYFSNAHQFDPERFLDERATETMAHWYPFSYGPRNCVGKPLAMAELKIFVAHVLYRYSLRPHKSAVEPISVTSIITKPHQVLLTLERRAR